jgi:hypothetical protein
MIREQLLRQYADIRKEMLRVGLDPIINEDAIEIFSDSELVALIKDSMFRYLRFRRLEGEL